MTTLRWRSFATVIALVAVISAFSAFYLHRSSTASASSIYSSSPAPQAIKSLDDELDACVIAHGASRIDLEGGGYSYNDPGNRAVAACAAPLKAIADYEKTDEFITYENARKVVMQAYWSCMTEQGKAVGGFKSIDSTDPDHGPDVTSAVYKAANEKCGGEDLVLRG